MSATATTITFFEDLKAQLVHAFMNAPQIDVRNNMRVPVDLMVESSAARTRVMGNQSGSYWAAVPQLPVLASTSA